MPHTACIGVQHIRALMIKEHAFATHSVHTCAELLAESVVWRGCRHGGAAIGAVQGLDFLKAGLEAEGWRGVRQLAAVAMPLPIPLPFPRAFQASLTSEGDLVRLAAFDAAPAFFGYVIGCVIIHTCMEGRCGMEMPTL